MWQDSAPFDRMFLLHEGDGLADQLAFVFLFIVGAVTAGATATQGTHVSCRQDGDS